MEPRRAHPIRRAIITIATSSAVMLAGAVFAAPEADAMPQICRFHWSQWFKYGSESSADFIQRNWDVCQPG